MKLKSSSPLYLSLGLLLILVAIFGLRAFKNPKVASGIDSQYIDPTVRMQDDFFKYVNGKWLKTVEIPKDKSTWGSFVLLREVVQNRLKEMIETASKDLSSEKSAELQKIGDFYTSFMDEKTIEEMGIRPLEEKLKKIAALKDKKEVAIWMGYSQKVGIETPFGFGISQDEKDSTRYVVYLGESGLSLPDRDYYIKQDDKQINEIRAQYLIHVEKMLTLMGDQPAAPHAKKVLEIETQIAQIHWTKVENRDPIKRYNKMDLVKLRALVPSYDWDTYLQETGLAGKIQEVIVNQPSYFSGFETLIKKIPLEDWKIYFQWHLLSGSAPYLPKAFVDQNFSFYGKTLSGIPEMRVRWKRGIQATEGAMGEGLGKVYVEKYFPEESKRRMDVMVKNILDAYQQSINQLDWMGPETKKEAQLKLSKFTTKIGYPKKWRDYSGLKVDPKDLLGNVERSNIFDYDYELNKLGKPIDRDEWGMTPQTVNAYYNPQLNEIVFPASILQPPFFNPEGDDAVNYGGIGAVIGHEISHGFDDQGAKYDGDGNLRDWWSAKDHQQFEAKTKMLVGQYNEFSPLEGHSVNGELTLGENIADNAGLAIAYKAYRLSLKGKEAPVIDGLTGDQRFYMGFAQVWRGKVREQQILVFLKSDPHSPPNYRVNGTLRNQDPFYEAFGVQKEDKMYLPPDQRVHIW
ncbi:MAG: M13-type metalloendopeptidase [Verrucomicrobiota bacterium]